MIKVLNENGLEEALLGLGLSYNIISLENYLYVKENLKKTYNENEKTHYFDEEYEKTFGRMYKTACKLAGKGNGHDKFLESINVQMYVEAPRFIWQEFDTYRVGITKQSESTMHTIKKIDFDDGTFIQMEDENNNFDFAMMLKYFERIVSRGNIHDIKVALPEGFIQARVVSTNYKTIRNIYYQRINHRMKWWKDNLNDLLRQLRHPEFIVNK